MRRRMMMGRSVDKDPYWNNVSLLLSFSGEDNSTTIIDSSKFNHSVSVVGAPKISTAQSMFGGSSLLHPGTTSDYIEVAESQEFNFGADSFTAECFIRMSAVNVLQAILGNRTSDTNPVGLVWGINLDTAGKVNFFATGQLASIGNIVFQSAISINTWIHVAFVRNGSTFMGFVDGVVSTSTLTSSLALRNNAPKVWSGKFGGSLLNRFNGYIDEIRITKGVARYTENFVPPSKAFPRRG